MSSEKMLVRICGLLRQAESKDNPHEAEAFMEAAQRLATAVDLAVARAQTASRERRHTPAQRAIALGEPGRKGLRTYVQLFVAVSAANDVKCDVENNSTRVFAYGFETDIDTCQALYSSLLMQMVRASDTYLWSGEHRPVAGVIARLNFQLAFAARIGQRLEDLKRDVEATAVSADTDDADGTSLVLRDKQIELRDFYKETSEARGAWRGPQSGVAPSDKARRAARSARLGNLPEIGGVRGQLDS